MPPKRRPEGTAARNFSLRSQHAGCSRLQGIDIRAGDFSVGTCILKGAARGQLIVPAISVIKVREAQRI